MAEWNTNRFAGRLSNTTEPIGRLVNNSHAILLENALIDTTEPLNFVFPKNLQPQGDPGAYIVQAKGPINNAFRAMLADMGATIISYIPNDAYLVRASAGVASALAPEPSVQAVITYEPYYKIQSSLLYPAVKQMQLPDDAALNLALYANDAPATISEIEKLGGQVIGQNQSPFGPVVRVIPPKDWTTLATLSGVQIIEPFHARATANDLSRATVGVAADSLTPTNYLGLTGAGVTVEVNDTGIDANHPDLKAGGFYNRALDVIGDAPQSLVDTNGHGTHVAGIIAGDGAESMTVTNAPGSILPGGTGTNYQFRGMAPGATLFSVGGIEGVAEASSNFISDQYFQEVPARTNALISNNSWVYVGDSSYDLAAASYDAAVRDALPKVTGSQPVLFVFAAGNDGNGNDNSDQGSGTPDSIESPATAKNVITVGAIQENRNITNVVTNADGTISQPWQAETSTDSRVAGFSARGNVGIGIEGKYGRFKPDVVAPGTFIISTRSEQWDIGTYFYQNPTNYQTQTFSGITLAPGSLFSRPFPFVPSNAVQLTITTYPNAYSPFSFAYLPTLIGLFSSPGYQYSSINDPVIIPGAGLPTLQQILSSEGFLGAFNYAISNNTSGQVVFDLETDVVTTNGTGDYYLVLSNLDNSIGTFNGGPVSGPWYRYESGTSMSAADVSGVLALMQQFYTNAYATNPSPAMLKAMLVNGAQVTSSAYNYVAQNSINPEGWGLVNLPGSLPIGITNRLGTPCAAYVQDQSPTNALATGDSQTYYVSLTSAQPLRATLAWTDPPGDPVAAIKLVNNLVLVVTNLSDPANPFVYYGNDIGQQPTYNDPHATNTPPVFDSINNVQTVNLPSGAGTNFTVTVMGYRVNVNAVTAQTNNVVQDYALVISTGVTNSMTVSGTPTPSTTPPPLVSNPTGDQQITYLSPATVSNATSATSYQLLLNQFVGANTPLLGTNTIVFPPTNGIGPDNWQVTVGMTNQWHFYVVTNVNGYSNAAFVTFNPNAPDPDTLSIPREGVFADTVGNASRDADIDLYVTTDPTITNLNPAAISNCVVGTQIGADVGASFAGASLGRGTTEFVVDTNSQSRIPPSPPVYYVGVKSEDQMAAEYGFVAIFSQNPFSTMNHGVQTVYGAPVPMNIPDGSPKVPGKGYVFGLAIYPEQIRQVTVSNEFYHQNFGDLIGTLTLNGGHADVLNNHDSLGSPPGPYDLIYDDSPGGVLPGSRPSDGPGTLNNFIRRQALGVWQLTEVDDSLTQTGYVNSLTLTIYPHQNLGNGASTTNYVPPGGWVYDYIVVPPGAPNLTIYGTNITSTANPPVELFVKYGSEPTTNVYDAMTNLDSGTPPGNSIKLGPVPPLESGVYYIGLYDPDTSHGTQTIVLYATIGPGTAPVTIYSSGDTPKPILDDAVTDDSIYVTNYAIISSLDVALAVQHPRISDLVFHLISPDGTRMLLMENRGGTDTNGAGGISTITTNIALASTFEGAAGDYGLNDSLDGWQVTGSQVSNQVSVVTDPANAYQGTNFLALANGTLSATLATTPGVSYTLTFAYRGPGIAGWWRGESNSVAVDSAYGNNGTLQNITFTNGEVGQAFVFNGTSSIIQVPANADIDVGSGSGFTLETWVNPATFKVPGDEFCVLEWNNGTIGTHLWLSVNTPANGYANIFANLIDNTGVSHPIYSAPDIMALNAFQHIALTYNKATGIAVLYRNGVAVTNQYLGTFTPQTTYPFYMGYRPAGVAAGSYLDGDLDEASVYSRFLSPSEIQAIYASGTNGKFDPVEFPLSARQSLAEAQVSINNGGSLISTNFFGSAAWQTNTITFTASSGTTTVQLQGVEPGMLLDNISAVSVVTNYNYLVFTENTSLTTTPIKFAIPPFGGAGTNAVAWQNGFEQGSVGQYYTPFAPSYFAGGWYVSTGSVDVLRYDYGGGTSLPPGGGNYYVDLDGSSAGTITTNIATVPGRTYTLSFYYSKNPYPFVPTPPSAEVLVGGIPVGTVTTTTINNSWTNLDWQTASYVFTATSPLTQLTFHSLDSPDSDWGVLLDDITLTQPLTGLYYLPEQSLDDAFDGENAHGTWTLEIQDDRVGATNPPPSLLSWQLRFNYVTLGTNIYPATPLALPQLPEQIAIAGQPFTVTNAATGGTTPYTYTLTGSVTNLPLIDTNGVITWMPTTNQAPAVYTFTNIVTDATLTTATDIFQVLVVLTNNLPAFPGAEGPGGGAIGGRGGDVYHVINVNDGGPGSLRYGITNTSGNRTIVFDVSGTINLQTNLLINDPYLTIAGQTAPGDGITIQGYTTSAQNAHDDVLRFLRCRPGDIYSPAFQDDSFHFVNVTNSIADHISASWSIDEALSTTHSTNISVQWSIIAQPLNHSAHYMDSGAPGFQAHGYGSLLRYGSGAVGYYHNLYADNYSRNPRPGDNLQLDFINNVVCNWGIFAGYNEDDAADNPDGYTNFLNYIGNYFIAGSNTTANPNIAFQANVPNAADTQIYQGTNYIDPNAATNLLNGTDTGWGMFNGTYTQLGAPTPMPGIAVTATNPPASYEQVLAFAGNTMAGASVDGAYLLRDAVDTNIVTGVRGKSGQIIDFISSNRFSGVYLITNSETTYSGYTGAGTYWQSQGITNFVGVNPWPVLDSAPQPLDSDGDGMPDYWEITLAALGNASMNPAVPNNNHLNPDGYTDLEHYINWLAAPHALTVSNTPVDVDLYAIVGRTGNWGFGVTNATNGTVSLGVDGHTATFTPTNGFIGFASFDFSATNLVTSNYFDVTVSVFVSATNITYSSEWLSNGKFASNSATNTVPANSILYYLVKVPTNALFATNRLLFASGPVNLLFSGVGFPTGTNIGDYTLLTGSTGGSSVLSTTSVPTNIVQGGTYYLGVQNTGGAAVNFGVEVDFNLILASTNIITGPTITATNINGTNGFLLQWSGPTNYQYTIQWTTNLAPPALWSTVLNPVINVAYTPTNGNYSWFDDGTLAGGWPPQKFYRILAGLISAPITNSTPVTNVVVAGTITPLMVNVPANATAASNLLISATGPLNVWFNQNVSPVGDTNAGDVLMLSSATGGNFLLTGSSTPPLAPGATYYLGLQNTGTTNVSFVFQVNFGFGSSSSSNATTISSITFTNIGTTNGILLTWFAPTNYRFQVQWTPGLSPVSWTTIPGVVLTNLASFTPTNGIGEFQYFDNGLLTGGFGPLKFYRLIAYPAGATIPPDLLISSVLVLPGGLQIQWDGSTNYQYEVAWTTNLALPMSSWNILSNLIIPAPLAYTNGVFTYTATNALTAGSAPAEFFRVLLLP